MKDRPAFTPDFAAAEQEQLGGDQQAVPPQVADEYAKMGLTEQQLRFAEGLGLRPAQYSRGLQEARRRGWSK